jgi:iron complex transport system substrate-binding protein
MYYNMIKNHFLIALMTLFLSGCENVDPERLNGNNELTDMLGRRVKVPEKLENIVCLNAGTLRLITWLNATEYVGAIEYNEKRRNAPYLFAHPELREKPVIGSGNTPDPELLAALAPDAIFSTYITKAEADKLQSRTGIPVLAIKYGNFDNEIDTVFHTLRFLGKALNRNERAEFLIRYIRETIADLHNRTASIPENNTAEVYVGGIAYRGSHGLTSTEPRYPSFRFLNTKNVAAALDPVMTSPRDVLLNAFIDTEQLIQWNPEYIFLDMSSNTYQNKMLDEPWIKLLRAANQEKIYTVFPYNWYTTNYSTILVNSYFIGKALYPAQFIDVDPETRAHEIYKNILGKSVYDNMVEQFGKCKKLNWQKL